MAIKKIKNPYIPETFDGSLDCCCAEKEKTDSFYYETRYDAIDLADVTPFREDVTGAYTPQGGCVHGAYIYRAMVKEDDEPAIIQKIRITDGTIVTETNARAYGHANDLFVKDGMLHVLHSSSTNIVYRLNLETLAYIDTLSSGPTRWGQAFNATDGVDVIGPVGAAYLSVYINGSFMYRIKPENAFSALVRQGLFCTDNYIGVVLDNAYGAVIDNDMGSRVVWYTWNGMFVKSTHIPIAEIEWADYADGKLYFGTYEGRDENDVKSGKIYVVPYDLYPEQTVLTGRPTEVSGGLNNLQRLPEGTPVKLWQGHGTTGTITLQTASTRIKIDEDGPFRYLKFEFDGANACTFDWFVKNNGVVTLREFDITAAANDTNLRFRELRMTFNATTQTFTIASNLIEEILYDISEDKIKVTKNPTSGGDPIDGITVKSIWGFI